MKITEERIIGTFMGFTPFQIHCELGSVVGTYQHNEDRICISHAQCEGCFKELVNYLVGKFRTNDILIHGVMNLSAWVKLRGFMPIIIRDPLFDEDVLCLEGKWENKNTQVGINEGLL